MAGRLRLDLAQFRELESFAAFGSDLDRASKAQLERGQRLVELLKQPQYSPMPVERQVVSVWTGTNGYLDDVPVDDVKRFEREFLDYVEREHAGIYDAILSGGKLEDSTIESMKKAVHDFREQFDPSGEASIEADVAADDPAADYTGEDADNTGQADGQAGSEGDAGRATDEDDDDRDGDQNGARAQHDAEPMDKSEQGQESIRRHRRSTEETSD